MTTRTRNPFLDALKAYSILLVVFGHCIQYGSGHTFVENNLYFENVFFQAIYSFHMPLFMLISGFLFGFSVKKGWVENIRKKFHSLLVPAFVWAILSVALAMAHKFVHNEPITLLVFAKSYLTSALFSLWFLWALFGCSLLVALVNRFCKDSIWIYAAIFIASFFIPDSFSFGLYKYMYPYFLAGYFFQKLNCSQIVALLQSSPAQTHRLLSCTNPPGGCGGFAADINFCGGGEPCVSSMEGRDSLAILSGGEQSHLQLLHSVAVVMAEKGELHCVTSCKDYTAFLQTKWSNCRGRGRR